MLCIRWVDDDLVVHEDFIGMHPLKDTGADHIVFVIKDILQKNECEMRVANVTMVRQPWQDQKLE